MVYLNKRETPSRAHFQNRNLVAFPGRKLNRNLAPY